MAGASRVLIVEDDVDIGELLDEYFRDHGFEVTWARTGRAAIAAARREGAFSAALVDLSLSDLEGAEVVAALREALPSARIAVVTGLAPQAIDPRAVRSSDRVFAKPTDPDELVAFAKG
jgi:two-component system response regulator RegA